MKKLILLLLFIPLVSFGQDDEKKGLNNILEQVKKIAKEYAKDGEIKMIKVDTIAYQYDVNKIKKVNKNRYELYATQNIYNFLKLNTATGQINQVQWSTEENNRFETYINPTTLVDYEGGFDTWNNLPAGRFKLYPSENIYTFLLLDKEDGRTWQVQWSLEGEKRFIIPIN